jgi:hypothetical protein
VPAPGARDDLPRSSPRSRVDVDVRPAAGTLGESLRCIDTAARGSRSAAVETADSVVISPFEHELLPRVDVDLTCVARAARARDSAVYERR